jgi:hypothetical protein
MKTVRILLQTTIPKTEDDWSIERFTLLRDHLASIRDNDGNRVYEVTARNRESDRAGNDAILSALDRSDFDQLWLFAVDSGNGLSVVDCEGITRFRQRGGGLLTTRDHEDLGSSLCTVGGVGHAHFFHSQHRDPDEDRNVRDDQETRSISWPNYHSGNNGDYQRIEVVKPVHELLMKPDNASGVIEYFPAHPHEGSVGVPAGEDHARVIARGTSQVTRRPFNLIVAFESALDRNGNTLGRAIAESSFHHFVDYNWDVDAGCPSGVIEKPGDQIERDPEKLDDVKRYVENLARWLSPS